MTMSPTKVARLLGQRELAWQIQHLRREVESRYDFKNLIGESKAMRRHRRTHPQGWPH